MERSPEPMLKADIKRQTDGLPGAERVASKTIEIEPGLSVAYQIASENANIVEFCEKTLLDLVASNIGRKSSFFTDFSFVLEKLNKALRELSKEYSLQGLRVFFAGLLDEELYFSILGRTHVYFVKNELITDIAQGMDADGIEFSYVSNGTVHPGNCVFLSNVDLLDSFATDDLVEISRIYAERGSIVDDLFRRELAGKSCDVVIICNPRPIPAAAASNAPHERALAAARGAFESVSAFAKRNETIATLVERVRLRIDFENPVIRRSAFAGGIVVSITLLYLIISSVFVSTGGSVVPEEERQKLVTATSLIEKAGKELGTPELFRRDIAQAESLIFEVRQKQLFLTDVNKLLTDVSVLKKQMNGIESFAFGTANLEYAPASSTGGALVGIFEESKRFYFLSKNRVTGPFIKGGQASSYALPDGEDAVAGDLSNGILYILTDSNRVIKFQHGEFAYANVAGQRTWEPAKALKTFNGNAYLLSDAQGDTNIYRHRPGVGGFNAKDPVLAETKPVNFSLFDFAVDGGFYLLKSDLSIDRVLQVPSYVRKSIVINKLPEGYSVADQNVPPKIFLGQSANYVYVLLNNSIWIFQPNSKRFQDITSLTYVGQLEPTGARIATIHIPQDGTLLVGADDGKVYRITFEVVDGNILVR